MTDNITIEFDSAPLADALDRLATALGPAGMAPAMKKIGEALAESTRLRFVTSTAPDGRRWAPNAERTYLGLLGEGDLRKDGRINARGTAKAAGKKPLIATRQLSDSIVWQLIDGDTGVVVGTNRFADKWDAGAAVHHFGNRKGTIPARPFLGLSAADEARVHDIIERHVLGAQGG